MDLFYIKCQFFFIMSNIFFGNFVIQISCASIVFRLSLKMSSAKHVLFISGTVYRLFRSLRHVSSHCIIRIIICRVGIPNVNFIRKKKIQRDAPVQSSIRLNSIVTFFPSRFHVYINVRVDCGSYENFDEILRVLVKPKKISFFAVKSTITRDYLSNDFAELITSR